MRLPTSALMVSVRLLVVALHPARRGGQENDQRVLIDHLDVLPILDARSRGGLRARPRSWAGLSRSKRLAATTRMSALPKARLQHLHRLHARRRLGQQVADLALEVMLRPATEHGGERERDGERRYG
ncbi:MAG: hypothetical protein R3F65_22095 [bacterium]